MEQNAGTNGRGAGMRDTMTIEEAIEIAVSRLSGEGYIDYDADEDYRAAEILRNMAEEPLEKKDTVDCAKCITCGTLYDFEDGCEKCGFHSCFIRTVYGATKTCNSTRVLEIVKIETDVKFEEVQG